MGPMRFERMTLCYEPNATIYDEIIQDLN